jgi:hypothetical protein
MAMVADTKLAAHELRDGETVRPEDSILFVSLYFARREWDDSKVFANLPEGFGSNSPRRGNLACGTRYPAVRACETQRRVHELDPILYSNIIGSRP